MTGSLGHDLHMTAAMWRAVSPALVRVDRIVLRETVCPEDVAYKVEHSQEEDDGDPFVHLVLLGHYYIEDGNTRVAAAKARGDELMVARVLGLW